MGVTAARMQRARTRSLVGRIQRQAAASEPEDPERISRGRRIESAKRDARRALRARASARRAGRTAEVAAGAALRQLLDEGLRLSDTAVLVGLSRNAVKRLLRVAAAATDLPAVRSSTAPIDNHAPGDDSAKGEANGTAPGATTERNL